MHAFVQYIPHDILNIFKPYHRLDVDLNMLYVDTISMQVMRRTYSIAGKVFASCVSVPGPLPDNSLAFSSCQLSDHPFAQQLVILSHPLVKKGLETLAKNASSTVFRFLLKLRTFD